MSTKSNLYHFGLTYAALENLCPGIKVNPRNSRKDLDYSDMMGSGDIVTPLLVCKMPDGSFYPAKGNRRLTYWRNIPDIVGSIIINDLSAMSEDEALIELDRLGADHGQELGLKKSELFAEYQRLAALGYNDESICQRLRHALANSDWLAIRTAYLKGHPDATPAMLFERFKAAQKGTLQLLRGIFNLPTSEQCTALAVWDKTSASPDGLTVKDYANIGNDLQAIRKAGFQKEKLEGKSVSKERGELREAAIAAALAEAEEEGKIISAFEALKAATTAKKPKSEDKDKNKRQKDAVAWFLSETFEHGLLGKVQRVLSGELSETESDKLRLELLSVK